MIDRPMLYGPLEKDRLWSNTYLAVGEIKDPAMRLRMLRGQVASQLWSHRRERHRLRVWANEDIDAGDQLGARVRAALIGQESAVISALQLIAARLREK